MPTTRIYLGTRPVEFKGTRDDLAANWATHCFISFDPEEGARCGSCDSREWSTSAGWPCGFDVPREAFYRTEEAPFIPWTHRVDNLVREIDYVLEEVKS